MTVGVSGGFGCLPEKLPEDERQAATIPDKFRHEIATVYNLKGRGLVVLTSCSHRGVVEASAAASLDPRFPRARTCDFRRHDRESGRGNFWPALVI